MKDENFKELNNEHNYLALAAAGGFERNGANRKSRTISTSPALHSYAHWR